jgi:hypothetical protein
MKKMVLALVVLIFASALLFGCTGSNQNNNQNVNDRNCLTQDGNLDANCLILAGNGGNTVPVNQNTSTGANTSGNTPASEEVKLTACDIKKVSKLVQTDVEFNPAATEGSNAYINDTLQGGEGGVEPSNTMEYIIDADGNITGMKVNGTDANPNISMSAAFIKGDTECIGMKLLTYVMSKNSPSYAKLKAPEFNVEGKWFEAKSMMGGDSSLMRITESTSGEDKLVFVETRALGQSLPSAPENDQIEIRYYEANISTGFLLKAVMVDYPNASYASSAQIDTSKSVEAWISDHSSATYFKSSGYAYTFR